jgi:hypothetical protein
MSGERWLRAARVPRGAVGIEPAHAAPPAVSLRFNACSREPLEAEELVARSSGWPVAPPLQLLLPGRECVQPTLMFRQQQRAKGHHVGIAQQLDQVILPFDVMDPKNMGDRQRGLVCSVAHLAGPRPHFACSSQALIRAAASGSSGSSARSSFTRFRLVEVTIAGLRAPGRGGLRSSFAGGGGAAGSGFPPVGSAAVFTLRTIASLVTATPFRFRGGRFGRWVYVTM